jgi:hypothetical protein
MPNTKLNADGYALDVWFALPNYAANPAKPTVAELNAATNVTASISWDSFGFGAQASTQNSQPSFIDVGNTSVRGFAQFGGAISFFYPGSYAVDATNANYVTFAALRSPRTAGYIIMRIDGKAPSVGTAATANDFVQIYQVISDGYDDAVEGQNSFTYAINFLAQGGIYNNALVATAVTVVTPSAVGTPNYVSASQGKTPLTSSLTGRTLYQNTGVFVGYPGRFTWTSSSPAVGTVSKAGVFTALSAGTTNVIATDPVSGISSTALAITTT